ERYLADEPVEACPPSAGYKLRKFARKNKKLLATAAAFVALLLVGAVVSTWQAVRARQAEAAAVEGNKQAAKEAGTARAVSEFLQHDLLAEANPNKQPNRDLKLRTVLDRATAKITGKFDKQPLVEASIRLTIGIAYRELGEYPTAQLHLDAARSLRCRELG